MPGTPEPMPRDHGSGLRRDDGDPATAVFVQHRNLLFTVAYELLGSASDAEDVLQEAWLRWTGVDFSSIREPRAYLVRIATREALMRLRTLARRKESYIGPWLPEPLLTSPDVAEDVELADSISMAMLLVMETLSPTERAVFVLREVFDLKYDEIADAVGKTPAAARQIAHRAREHVAARRPREAVSTADSQRALDAFKWAIETGDLQRLFDLLAPDVVLLTDGGGVVQALQEPIVGVAQVARVTSDGLPRIRIGAQPEAAQFNCGPGLIIRKEGQIESVVAVHVEAGKVDRLYVVRNPEKLSFATRETTVSR